METYKVSAPPGKWSIERPPQVPALTFSRHKEGLLSQFAHQERALSIVVEFRESDRENWYMNEIQAANSWTLAWTNMETGDPAMPTKLVDKGETTIGDKKVYFVKFLVSELGQDVATDHCVYFYFPPTFKRQHKLFFFQSFFSHTLAMRLYKNPGTEALEAVINSLEIVDPLQAVPGPDGDLLRAAARGELDAVQQAVAKGTSVNASTAAGTPLGVASLNGRREIVDFLLAQGAEVNRQDEKEGRTALVQAIVGGEPEIAEVLVGREANVNPPTKSGLSPLMCAICMRLDRLVPLLLDHGAVIDAMTGDGETALTYAVWAGSLSYAQALLDRGASIDHQTDDGETALTVAATYSPVDIAIMLVDRGANVNLKTKTGWTALMGAINKGKPDLAAILIAKGADINAKTSKGWTPLMVAAERGDVQTAKLLLSKGAYAYAMTTEKVTALKIAKSNKNAELVKLLQSAGAK